MHLQAVGLYTVLFLVPTLVTASKLIKLCKWARERPPVTRRSLWDLAKDDPILWTLAWSLVQIALLTGSLTLHLRDTTDDRSSILLIVHSGVDQVFQVRGWTDGYRSLLTAFLVYCTTGSDVSNETAGTGPSGRVLRVDHACTGTPCRCLSARS